MNNSEYALDWQLLLRLLRYDPSSSVPDLPQSGTTFRPLLIPLERAQQPEMAAVAEVEVEEEGLDERNLFGNYWFRGLWNEFAREMSK